MKQIKIYSQFIETIKNFNTVDNNIRALLIVNFKQQKITIADGSHFDFRFKEYIKKYDIKINDAIAMFKVILLDDSFKHLTCNPLKIIDISSYFTFNDANNVLSKGDDIFKYDHRTYQNKVYYELHIWGYMCARNNLHETELKPYEIINEDIIVCDESSIEMLESVPIFHKENKAHVKIVVATQGKVKCEDKIFVFYPSDDEFSKTLKVFEDIIEFSEPEFVRRDVPWSNSGEVPYYIKYKINDDVLYIMNDDNVYIESTSVQYTGNYAHGCQVDREHKHFKTVATKKDISLNEALDMLDEKHLREYIIAKRYDFSEEKMKNAEKSYKEKCFEIYKARKEGMMKIAQEFVDNMK